MSKQMAAFLRSAIEKESNSLFFSTDGRRRASLDVLEYFKGQ